MTPFRTILILSLSATIASAAELAVGPTASGNGSGSDWNNIAQWSSFTPVRGNTYYLMDGDYGSKDLDTAASSTTLITIRKATEAAHGPATGWSSTYGDGQAAMTGQLTIQTHYWVIDGAIRDENDWWDESAYGWKITRSGHSDMGIEIALNGQNQVNNVSISNIAIILPYFNDSGAAKGISTDNGSDPVVMSQYHTFSRMLIRGGNQHWFVRHSHDAVIEYCASERTGGSGEEGNNYHGNVINLYWNPDRCIIRYNKFRDHFNIDGTGGTSIISITGSQDHRIYGNVFLRCRGSNGLIGFFDGDGAGTYAYNNTFVDSLNSTGIYLNGSGNIARNNLWVASENTPQISGPTASDNTTSGATSLFVDYDGEDFRLAADLAGYTLSSPYNTDLLGNTRGADGTFDRGAYEFGDAPATGPTATVNNLFVR